jgi:mersacidin/lichenicidin family type 2 lantibiotic
MSSEDLIRIWKNPDHRDTTGADHPAGQIELADMDVSGGTLSAWPCITLITQALSCQVWECGDTVKVGSCNDPISYITCC